MAACAQQAFTAAVMEKGEGGGKYISIKICMFIAAALIYFYFLSLFLFFFSAAFQSLLVVGGTRGASSTPSVYIRGGRSLWCSKHWMYRIKSYRVREGLRAGKAAALRHGLSYDKT